MQGQSLKLRLFQLKKASIELKSKVLNEHKMDYEAVTDILNSILPQPNGQNLGSSRQQSSSSSAMHQAAKNNSIHALQSSNNSLNYSPVSSMFVTPTSLPLNSNINKSAPQRVVHQRSSSHESLQDNVDMEIQRMKRQNEQLESQISSISEEVSELRKKEKALEDEQWKNSLPFIYRKSQLGVFITKLFVKEYDYDKIDYEMATTEIIQDKMLIFMPTKPCREYKLLHLAEVKYVAEKVIKIDFKIDQTVFVFLQFGTPEDRESWDLALFVNQKIITSKELDRSLFHQAKQKLEKDDTSITPHFSKKNKSKSSLRFADERIEQRAADQRYLEPKFQKSRKTSFRSITEKKADKSIASKGSQNSENRQEDSQRFINQFQYTLNGYNQSLHTPHNWESAPGNSENDKELKEFMVFGQVGDSHYESRAHTSKFNLGDPNNQTEDFAPPSFSPEPNLYATQRQEEDEAQKWQRAVSQLKSGYFFTKYARDGIKPHNKHVLISQDEGTLSCLDTNNRNQRKDIPIENIKKVRYPSIDEGIKKFANNDRIQHFCVIQYSANGTDKFIQLGSHKPKFIERFATQLKQFLKKKGVLISD